MKKIWQKGEGGKSPLGYRCLYRKAAAAVILDVATVGTRSSHRWRDLLTSSSVVTGGKVQGRTFCFLKGHCPKEGQAPRLGWSVLQPVTNGLI